jgi:tetratricopeptide (TPR) repeat protein
MFAFLDRFAWFRSPSDPKGRAAAAMARGDFAGAETEFEAALAAEHASTERAFLLNKRGVARVRMGRRDEALADFRAAVECHPGYAPAMTNIGNVVLESGDLPGAIAQYEAAVRADDFYAVAHLNLGIAYKQAGRVGEGVREIRRASSLEVRGLWSQRKRG